jgi:hypothetical protein
MLISPPDTLLNNHILLQFPVLFSSVGSDSSSSHPIRFDVMNPKELPSVSQIMDGSPSKEIPDNALIVVLAEEIQ